MFFVNQETGTWTVLQAYGDGMACMIFNGKDFTSYSGDQPMEIDNEVGNFTICNIAFIPTGEQQQVIS